MVNIEIVHSKMRTQSVHVRNIVVLQLLGAVFREDGRGHRMKGPPYFPRPRQKGRGTGEAFTQVRGHSGDGGRL
jgi:hypothetical protein